MSTAAFWQRGEALDFVNETTDTIAANSIVEIGDHIAVAGTDIEPGALGSIHVVGVFDMPKTGSADVKIGASVYWDGSGITDTAPSGDGKITTPIGYAAAPAAASDNLIKVKLNG